MNKKRPTQEAMAKRLKELELEPFDLSDLKGVLPADRELTQNIGCVGKKSKNQGD